jgi:adenine-specific DNA methylase
MLKRLIEVALPLAEVSEQSAREKSLRIGNISTLHIWWARQPLATCRAVVFASLIPDPDDLDCPDEFRKLASDMLGKAQFKPTNSGGASIKDTLRNRCLEFVKHLVKSENSNSPGYIELARTLIKVAYKFLHPNSDSELPKILDPFAGGGAIPLEALRLGCESHAIELNPVAHLIELCTFVYPQKHGQPDSRPVPDYIKRLITQNQAKRKVKDEVDLFDKDEVVRTTDNEVIPDIEITDAEYRKNPLASDVKYWGHWMLKRARKEIGHLYAPDADGSIPVGYLWARAINCPNPTCRATIPLLRQLWVCNKSSRKVALRMIPVQTEKSCRFDLVEDAQIDFDPSSGTVQRGNADCPFCNQVAPVEYLRSEAQQGRMSEQLMAVVLVSPGRRGKIYRAATKQDVDIFAQADNALKRAIAEYGTSIVPSEPISKNARGQISPPLYGLNTFGHLFNARQTLALTTFSRLVREAAEELSCYHHGDYSKAVVTYLALAHDRLAENDSSLCRWNGTSEKLQGTFGRQALPMVWDYCETSPFGGAVGSWDSLVENQINGFLGCCFRVSSDGVASRGSSDRLPLEDHSVDLVITDPPYYDAVPYADLSDFFYVWLKRSVGDLYPMLFRPPLTPKTQEVIQAAQRHAGDRARAAHVYEEMIGAAFSEMYRVLPKDGIACVMFAHKTTTAWETLIAGLLRSGLNVTASWPIHTEMKTRMIAIETAALASSVTLVCRKRSDGAGNGMWDDVRQELRQVAQERLDLFWSQGIRGADFFISAIGPALSVFGKYERVTKLSGEEVTVGQFLDEVRSLVTNYALTKILHTAHTAAIDPESRFYVVWKWSYGDANVPADESFKLSQALGMHTEEMWDRTGVLEKSGENVQAVPIVKRMRVKNLGEPTADGAPASLIDVLHRMCAFREKGDTHGMAQFFGQSGRANNPTLWLVAQAISEILLDGDKEKQLMQGLLNQREGLEEATRQTALF